MSLCALGRLDGGRKSINDLMVHIGLVAHDDTTAAVPSDRESLKERRPVLIIILFFFLHGIAVPTPCHLEIAKDFAAGVAADREHPIV